METKSKVADWSLLPDDLLDKILEKLCFLDRVHAVAACKDWNIPIPAISKYLPWLIKQDWSVVTCSNGHQKLCCKLNLYQALVNPVVYPPVCRIFDLGWKPAAKRIQVDGLAEVLHSKLGWALVEIRMISSEEREYSFLVLYNPFVQSFRFLPALEIPRIHTAAFSPPPSSSSDCVVYAVTRDEMGSRPFLRIHSYRSCNDRTKWKIATFIIHYDNPRQSYHSFFNSALVMEDGTFYCVDCTERSLIVFNSSNSMKLRNSIKLQTISQPLAGWENHMYIRDEAQLAEHEGELFLVLCCIPSWPFDTSLWYHIVYWYDQSAKRWSFKQRFDHQEYSSVHGESYYKSKLLATNSGHPLGMQMGNIWVMGGWFGFFQSRPYPIAIEKLFPSCHPDFSGEFLPCRELQWLSTGQAKPYIAHTNIYNNCVVDWHFVTHSYRLGAHQPWVRYNTLQTWTPPAAE